MRNPRRVVIVDDNEITRTGCEQLLARSPDLEIRAAVDHSTATEWVVEWDDVDVVLVDAAAEQESGDQFPGVAVARAVRARRRRDQTIVVVLTGHYLDDALRRRMSEVEADFFYSRTEMTSGDQLAAVLLDPDHARRTPPPTDHQHLAALGVTDRSRVDDLVRYAVAEDLDRVLSNSAAKKQGPASPRSRWWNNTRRRLAETGRIEPVNTDGSLPHREQDTPSLTQLRRLYTWATKVKTPRDGA